MSVVSSSLNPSPTRRRLTFQATKLNTCLWIQNNFWSFCHIAAWCCLQSQDWLLLQYKLELRARLRVHLWLIGKGTSCHLMSVCNYTHDYKLDSHIFVITRTILNQTPPSPSMNMDTRFRILLAIYFTPAYCHNRWICQNLVAVQSSEILRLL